METGAMLVKWVKRLAAVLLALAGLGAALFSAAAWLGEHKLQRSVDVRVVPVAYARDAAALRLGRALYETRGCGDCHGPDGRGRVLIDAPSGLLVRAPNITAGPGSATAQYREADWVRAVRHGVDPGRRPLIAMPSELYNRWTDAELAALVAYARSLPPVAGEPTQVRLPAHVKALYGTGAVRDAAEQIEHRRPPAEAGDPTLDGRDYLAQVEALRRLDAWDFDTLREHVVRALGKSTP